MSASIDNTSEHGEAFEQQHVHSVYEEIASHFSSTRYKPWPLIERFLHSLPDGSIGLDVGCGNGKYLNVNPKLFIVASDSQRTRSENLARIAASHQPHSTVVADILSLPHQQLTFDFAISIAVIHHLSTRERRVVAVKEILQLLKSASGFSKPGFEGAEGPVGGIALLYVWALEQKTSRRGWDKGDEQDVMVPWVKSEKKTQQAKGTPKEKDDGASNGMEVKQDKQVDATESQQPSTSQVYNRYYHLYKEGELEEDVIEAGGRVLEFGYERDNWWAIVARTN